MKICYAIYLDTWQQSHSYENEIHTWWHITHVDISWGYTTGNRNCTAPMVRSWLQETFGELRKYKHPGSKNYEWPMRPRRCNTSAMLFQRQYVNTKDRSAGSITAVKEEEISIRKAQVEKHEKVHTDVRIEEYTHVQEQLRQHSAELHRRFQYFMPRHNHLVSSIFKHSRPKRKLKRSRTKQKSLGSSIYTLQLSNYLPVKKLLSCSLTRRYQERTWWAIIAPVWSNHPCRHKVKHNDHRAKTDDVQFLKTIALDYERLATTDFQYLALIIPAKTGQISLMLSSRHPRNTQVQKTLHHRILKLPRKWVRKWCSTASEERSTRHSPGVY